MKLEQRTRARNSILGAFVADAASLGLHWVYSQRRILELAPQVPEFHPPDAADYEGGVGYFAHEQKCAGDLSQYGEQMLVMLQSLKATNGRYEKLHYTEQFRRHFGYGGDFVGYIDRPTRQTLDRIYRDENTAIEAVDAIPYNGPAKDQQSMLTKVLAAVKQHEGQKLHDRVEWYAAAMPDPERSRDYGLALVAALAPSDEFPGAIDEQLPAVSKLPPLVACYAGDADLTAVCESAIRVTNNASRAIDYGHVCTELLRASIEGITIGETLELAVNAGSRETSKVLTKALQAETSVRELSKEFGLHCDLGAGVPSLMYNLKKATSFTEAVRANLYAGGDNCGRAIILGAVCGAQFGMGGDAGIPEAWLRQIRGIEQLELSVDELLGV